MEEMRRRIAEELAKHASATVELVPGPGQEFYFVCECGLREEKDGRTSKREWIAQHQAETIAPVFREAQAEALDQHFTDVEHVDAVIHGKAEPTDAWFDFLESEKEYREYEPAIAESSMTSATYYAKYRARQIRSNDE